MKKVSISLSSYFFSIPFPVYRVVQRKVYGRVCTFFSTYVYTTDNYFFNKFFFLKLIGKKLQFSKFSEIWFFNSLTGGITEVQGRDFLDMLSAFSVA